MSKSTTTKLIRTFDVVDGKAVKRATKLEPQDQYLKECSICGAPMILAGGQIAYFHSECRAKRVNVLRGAKKHYKKYHD